MAAHIRARYEIQTQLDLLHFWQDEYRNCPNSAYFELCVEALESLTNLLRKHLPVGDSRISVLQRQAQQARHELSRMARMAQSASPAVGSGDTDEQ